MCSSTPARPRAATATGGCATSWPTIPATNCSRPSEDDLLRIALGIVHLNDRPRVRPVRPTRPVRPFHLASCCSCRCESYDCSLVGRAGRLLAQAFDGRVVGLLSELHRRPLARIHYIVGVTPGAHPEPDLETLEARIAEAARTWASRLDAALRTAPASADDGRASCLRRYRDAFPPGYQRPLRRRRGARATSR